MSEGILTVFASGDINGDFGDESYTILVEGTPLSSRVGNASPQGTNCTTTNAILNIPLKDLLSSAKDGVITITAKPSNYIGCFCETEGSFVQITLEFSYSS